MHELSIAASLVEATCEAARHAGARSVGSVVLKLGLLAGVSKDALLFGFDMAVQGTLMEGARLLVQELPVVIYCGSPSCRRMVQLTGIQNLCCPVCHQPSTEIRQGRELEIESIEIEIETDEVKT